VPSAFELRKEPAGCCAPPVRAEDRTRAAKEAPVFAALADEVRLRIVRLLARTSALCACEIQEAFDVSQPTIAHHLRVLRQAGVVDCERRGIWAYYFLERDAVKGIAQGLLDLL
jgi:ArsR family transcriptional regulator, arsenate/arsenite/antimonite-responsive transcriptional repressor